MTAIIVIRDSTAIKAIWYSLAFEVIIAIKANKVIEAMKAIEPFKDT